VFAMSGKTIVSPLAPNTFATLPPIEGVMIGA
jgi:hypothetical protein